MRLFYPLVSVVALLLSLSSAVSFAAEEKQAQKSDELTQAQQINILKTHITRLNKQVATLNRNQQSIAKKIGLTSPKKQQPQQPKIAIGNSASLGDKNAKVVLVEFTDLHCPFCKKFHNKIFPELEQQFIATGKLRFISKHYPIVQLHKNAAVAAFALECARADGDYKKAKDWLFTRGRGFNKASLDEFTQAMGLASDKFTLCVESPATAAQINEDMAIAKKIGVNQTPSFAIGLQKNGQVVDWKLITGAESVENFGKAIAEFSALAKTKD
ncbi:MAG: DsbA family protein [Colwellia sp.]|nr:DsbA family protein [Colwellia sp.]